MAALSPLGIFGKYLLLKRVASGGMAEIFLARPASSHANGRVVILKRILPHIADDPAFLQMFRSEIRVCMGLNHPNIVQMHEFGEIGGQPYIAMEYVEGRNLRQVTAKFSASNESLPLGLAVSVATQVAAGLHYAHTFENQVTGENLNVIHRDISPQNLLISFDGNVKIIDFGIAKAEGSAMERTAAGIVKGKACYVSPEQTCDEQALDGRSDIFSLGVVLWEMLVGHRLFSGDSDLTILRKVQDCENFIQPPSTYNPQIPSDLDAIVMKSLAKEPDRRYSTAADFQKDLRSFLMSYLHGYSYSDVAQSLQKLFKSEITDDRKSLRDLNQEAQAQLAHQEAEASSSTLTAPLQVGADRKQTGSFSLGTSGSMGTTPAKASEPVSEVMFLKKYGNRKVTWGHVALLAFYVLSIVGIKLDEKYFFFDRFMLPTEVVKSARATASAATSISGISAGQKTNSPVARAQAQARPTAYNSDNRRTVARGGITKE